ncbi:serine/threonine-protein kinase [Ramlibacter sp. PS4R-6]|uniref:serine/threonine-protein kinase n=1 Tax=Ramlibacter sp. PS4R-6 TaxID=3133438 RepID=UPI00309713F3
MNKLGKYQIRRTLGKGAMGIVYEGFDPVIERTVAIKTILPSQLDGAQYAEVMARFKREAQAAGRLNHPGIVAIYDYGEEVPEDLNEEEATMMAPKAAPEKPAERVAYIAMEFIKGRELKDLFASNERFKPDDAARIMGEVLEALDHAHAQGVVHRDIKPANIIVLDSGRIKIADFGIARVEKSELTQTGAVLGTPSYMSPEQFMGHPVDGRSDIFSCGVMLYQMMTGEKPFTGESTTTIMYKVLREEPVPPSQINLALAPALDAVIRKALAKNPNERYQAGKEFAEALRAAVAAPAGAATAGAAAAAVATKPPPVAAQLPAADRKAVPAGAWVAVAASLVAVVAGGYVFFGTKVSGSLQVTQGPKGSAAPVVSLTAGTAAPAVAAPPAEPGTMVLSALGVVDSNNFKGDAAALAAAAREDAKRQLVEKALALYVDKSSLEANRKVIEAKLLANSGSFIRTVVQEGTADSKGSLVEMPTRAVVNMRDVQRSLNQLSREERIDFIRNQGDPRISIRIDIGNADGGNLARDRSQLAENVVKDRIKSFGFRVWSGEGDNPNAASAQQADFVIKGDVKLRTMSMKLQASGLTVSKSAITSWTLKAIDTGTGEEVYLSTKMPQGQSWANEDQALAEIGKLVGDEFSKNFFLSYFSYRPQKTTLVFTGLPEGGSGALLRELRSLRTVLDAQAAEGGRFTLQLPPGSATDIVQDAVLRPLNAKMGEACFALGGATATEVNVTLSGACASPQMKTKLDSGAPAGWKFTAPKTTV